MQIIFSLCYFGLDFAVASALVVALDLDLLLADVGAVLEDVDLDRGDLDVGGLAGEQLVLAAATAPERGT